MDMTNSTQVSYFTLAAYIDLQCLRSFCFLALALFYVLIVCSNVLLILVIWSSRSLHEPMYLFLSSLFVNELYGSTGLLPFLLLQILSGVHTVSAPGCFLQIFLIYSYGNIEFLSLAIMSYDRYQAICHPLQYSTRMTSGKVAVYIALIWFLSFLLNFFTSAVTLSLQLCGSVINKVYCDYHSVVKLACSDTTVFNVYGLVGSAISVFGPFVLILYTYVRILQVCFSGSRQVRQKAVSTCSPHLASLLNFSAGACFEIIQSRFNMSNIPNVLRIFLSLYFLTCPPLFNPVMYGLKLSKIRLACRHMRWKRLCSDLCVL
ncbi:uncharacterized protein V6R79_019616 [Siganus canaliculatus]